MSVTSSTFLWIETFGEVSCLLYYSIPVDILMFQQLPKCLWQGWKVSCWPAWVWLSMHMLPQNTNSQLFSRREKKLSVSPRRKRICWILNWPTQYKMNLWKCLRKMKNVKNTGFWAFQLQHGWKKLTTVAGRRVSRFPCLSTLFALMLSSSLLASCRTGALVQSLATRPVMLLPFGGGFVRLLW